MLALLLFLAVTPMNPLPSDDMHIVLPKEVSQFEYWVEGSDAIIHPKQIINGHTASFHLNYQGPFVVWARPLLCSCNKTIYHSLHTTQIDPIPALNKEKNIALYLITTVSVCIAIVLLWKR